MHKEYRGSIVEESLEDNRILNTLEIVHVKISGEQNPEDRWHVYTVRVSKRDIEKLAKYIKAGRWYMHFWKENGDVTAIFKNKIFQFNFNDKSTWKKAVEHGLSLGIPPEQLDFLLE